MFEQYNGLLSVSKILIDGLDTILKQRLRFISSLSGESIF